MEDGEGGTGGCMGVLVSEELLRLLSRLKYPLLGRGNRLLLLLGVASVSGASLLPAGGK